MAAGESHHHRAEKLPDGKGPRPHTRRAGANVKGQPVHRPDQQGRQQHARPQLEADRQKGKFAQQQRRHPRPPDPRIDEGADRHAKAGHRGQEADPARIADAQQGNATPGLNLHRIEQHRTIDGDTDDPGHPAPRKT
ncbi:hypothetical protein E4T56_gene64, partial [Termitomyces sp. T112]